MHRYPDFLTSQINFFLAIGFVAVFGFFMMTTVLKLAHLEDPLVESLAASLAAQEANN